MLLSFLRPVLQVLVVGTIKEYAGTTAYMNINALRRLMKEDDVLTGAARSVEDLRPYVPHLLSAWQPTHGDPRPKNGRGRSVGSGRNSSHAAYDHAIASRLK